MTVLVIGSTGAVGSQVVKGLAEQGATVRALARDPAKLKAPAGVQPMRGDMINVASMRAALHGVDTLFLLNAVTPDEATQALLTLDLAQEVGIQRIVYLSVFNVQIPEVPHFASKRSVERLIEAQALPATILRPNYFMQNDAMLRDALKAGVYPQPIGGLGVDMVDTRDVAEAAVLELLRRERSPHPLPAVTIDLVGPETLTGAEVAAIWSSVLGREVRYGGHDLAACETQWAAMMPGWLAHDLRIMYRAFQRHGMVSGEASRAILEGLLSHPLRSYRAFAEETAASW